MRLTDTLSLAFRTIRGNKLRTGLTVAIIAFGIMALVGINTAIVAMKQKFTESFSAMGANGFIIHFKEFRPRMGGGPRNDVGQEKKGKLKQKNSNINIPITREQAEQFKSRIDFPAKVSISNPGTNDA